VAGVQDCFKPNGMVRDFASPCGVYCSNTSRFNCPLLRSNSTSFNWLNYILVTYCEHKLSMVTDVVFNLSLFTKSICMSLHMCVFVVLSAKVCIYSIFVSTCYEIKNFVHCIKITSMACTGQWNGFVRIYICFLLMQILQPSGLMMDFNSLWCF